MNRPPVTLALAHGILGWGDRALREGLRKDYFNGVRNFYLDEYGSQLRLDILIPTVSPADSIAHRAHAFTRQIEEALKARPDARIHIIAHSMGGLDARWAMAKDHLADRVASLTTIGTPHHGTSVATVALPFMPVLHPAGSVLDWLYDHAHGLWTVWRNGTTHDPMEFFHRVLDGFQVTRAQARNAVYDLTIEGMVRFNAELMDMEDKIRRSTNRPVRYFAYGGDLTQAKPDDRAQTALLCLPHWWLRYWGTPEERASSNDGLVSVWSAHYPWDQRGDHYVRTIPFAHFLQINWRFPDTRPDDALSDALKSVYREVMENILRVDRGGQNRNVPFGTNS